MVEELDREELIDIFNKFLEQEGIKDIYYEYHNKSDEFLARAHPSMLISGAFAWPRIHDKELRSSSNKWIRLLKDKSKLLELKGDTLPWLK